MSGKVFFEKQTKMQVKKCTSTFCRVKIIPIFQPEGFSRLSLGGEGEIGVSIMVKVPVLFTHFDRLENEFLRTERTIGIKKKSDQRLQ